MAFADEFADEMPDTLVATPGALDAFGAFVASGEVLSLPCHIQGTARLVRAINGKEVVSSFQAIVGGYNDLTVDGFQYTIPSRFDPSQSLEAILVEKYADEDGPCYETVVFK